MGGSCERATAFSAFDFYCCCGAILFLLFLLFLFLHYTIFGTSCFVFEADVVQLGRDSCGDCLFDAFLVQPALVERVIGDFVGGVWTAHFVVQVQLFFETVVGIAKGSALAD